MIQLNNIFSIDGPGWKYVTARYHTLSLRTSHAEPFSSTGLSICHHDLVLQFMSKNTLKKIHNNKPIGPPALTLMDKQTCVSSAHHGQTVSHYVVVIL